MIITNENKKQICCIVNNMNINIESKQHCSISSFRNPNRSSWSMLECCKKFSCVMLLNAFCFCNRAPLVTPNSDLQDINRPP